MDNLTKQQRSQTMKAVRSAHTAPELIVRRLVFSLGYRYKLHARKLPGCPDMIFPSQKKAIFVHGCFWHRHSCPAGSKAPRTNASYWADKLSRNRTRDERNAAVLRSLGWRVLILWECELNEASKIRRRIIRFLKSLSSFDGPPLSTTTK